MNQGAVIPVKVFVRARPFNDRENAERSAPCVTFYKENNQIEITKKMFAFDSVMDPSTSQKTAFEITTNSLIEKIMKGFNCTVLAYGQTGSGKTYTMGTEETTDSMTRESRGIIPRLVEQIFGEIKKAECPSAYQVYVSMLEIYDEKVNDLLSSAKDLQVREINGMVTVQGLTRNIVKDLPATMRQLETGCSLRSKGETAMNAKSSRSHAIFTISIDKTAMSDIDTAFKAKLHLVDLAGSERLKKTQAEGERMKEGIRINEGLLALGNVISALSDSNGTKHIPYRDSKITRLLQDSLGGNSFTVMIACISPADSNAEETLSTLRYADRAKKIKNKPVVNEDVGQAALLKQLQERVRQLEKELVERGDGYMPDFDQEKRVLEIMQQEKAEWKKREVSLTYTKSTLKEINNKLVETLKEAREKMLHIAGSSENYEDIIRSINEYAKSYDLDSPDNMELDIINEENEDEEGEEYVAKQAQLEHEIVSIGNEIKTRGSVMEKTKLDFEVLKKYDKEKAELNEKVDNLQEERDKLLKELKKTTTTGRLAEERRQRVKDLEGQINEFKKQLNDFKKLEKRKEECEQKMKKMDLEILELKKTRVKLQKTVKEENEKFRAQKIKADKELNQLKAQERKKDLAHGREMQAQAKKMDVMRQKLEESQRALKRFNTTQAKKSVSLSDANIANIKKFLKHEITHHSAFMETKRYRSELIDSRNSLNRLLKANNTKIEKFMREIGRGVDPEKPRREIEALEKENESYQRELDNVNAGIEDLMAKQGEYDENAAADERFKTVDNLAQSKNILKVLFEMAFEASETSNMQTAKAAEDMKTIRELKSKINIKEHNYQKKLDEFLERIEDYREQCNTEQSIITGKIAVIATKEELLAVADEFYEMRDKLNEIAEEVEESVQEELPKRKSKQTKFFGKVLDSQINIDGTPTMIHKPRRKHSINEPLNGTITIESTSENELNSTFVKGSPKRHANTIEGEAPPLKIRQKLDRTLGGIP